MSYYEPIRMMRYFSIVVLCLRLAPAGAQAADTVSVGAPVSADLMSPTPWIFKVTLAPQNEIPRITNSRALGYLLIQFMPDTNAIYYEVVVSKCYAPTVAHIHVGNASTVNGATVMFLYNATSTLDNSTAINGRLSSGILTPSNFLGPAQNITTMSALIDKYVRPGDLYSNIHTTEYPNGLLRGQINAKSLQGNPAARMVPDLAPEAPQ